MKIKNVSERNMVRVCSRSFRDRFSATPMVDNPNRIKRFFRRAIASAAIIGSLIAANPSPSMAGNSAEMMAGASSSVLDIKISTPVSKRTTFFVRNRTSAIYAPNVIGYFGLADIYCKIIGGLDAVIELQFVPGAKLIPRLGTAYSIKLGDLSVFNSGTLYLNEDTNLGLVSIVGYSKSLPRNLGLAFGAENLLTIGNQGLISGTQRLRLGLCKGKFEVGSAADFGESKGPVSKNIGAYAKIKF